MVVTMIGVMADATVIVVLHRRFKPCGLIATQDDDLMERLPIAQRHGRPGRHLSGGASPDMAHTLIETMTG